MIQIATRSEILKCLLCSYLPQSSFQSLSSTSWHSRTVTSTLFLVTLGSLLTILPTIIFISLLVFHFEFLRSFSPQSSFNFLLVMDLLFFTNSLINPIIYAVRMPKVRATVIQLLFCWSESHSSPTQSISLFAIFSLFADFVTTVALQKLNKTSSTCTSLDLNLKLLETKILFGLK